MKSFSLTARECTSLQVLAAQTADARLLRRAQALLWLDEGQAVDEIAERLVVTRQTIYNWRSVFEQRAGLTLTERLADDLRSGRPRTALGIIDPLIDAVIDDDPRRWGYSATIWTAPLLVEYLSTEHQLNISEPSVKLALQRLRLHWNRPRHTLALRPPTWRQSKGG
jgi:transposase